MDRIALNAGIANERAMLAWAEESAAMLRSGQRPSGAARPRRGVPS
jgi:hypothetical protein